MLTVPLFTLLHYSEFVSIMSTCNNVNIAGAKAGNTVRGLSAAWVGVPQNVLCNRGWLSQHWSQFLRRPKHQVTQQQH